jgi:hypothetical protein
VDPDPPPLDEPPMEAIEYPPPPAPGEAVPPIPFDGAIWIGGHFEWDGDWIYVAGRWMAPPGPGYGYTPPYYENRSGVVLYIAGYWQRPGTTFVPPPMGIVIPPPFHRGMRPRTVTSRVRTAVGAPPPAAPIPAPTPIQQRVIADTPHPQEEAPRPDPQPLAPRSEEKPREARPPRDDDPRPRPAPEQEAARVAPEQEVRKNPDRREHTDGELARKDSEPAHPNDEPQDGESPHHAAHGKPAGKPPR